MRLHGSTRVRSSGNKSQEGISLIETMIALCLLLIAAAGIMTMAMVAMSTTENQGHLAARTAEYSQDKMEQLLALQYQDQLTDTTQFPAVVGAACPPGCGLQVGGGLNPSAPVPGYSDYVDRNGSPVPAGANWQYIRVWQITQVAPNLIKISVLTQVRYGVGGTGALPTSVVSCLKSNPF